MLKVQILLPSKRIVLFFILLSIMGACTTQPISTTTVPELQQLRILNSGTTDIKSLVILFPNGPAWDAGVSRVEFGNIPAGQTSEYQNIPSGVYRYAAYEYMLENLILHQYVIDWMGESPMAGKKFTYQILLEPQKVAGDQITLVTVVVDEP